MLKKTLKDVALAAGVSPATVSNALNNRRGVSDEIREKIFQTARELGYTRESGARKPAVRLVVLKRHGLVVSDTPFFAALIEGIEKQCRLQGHELLVSHIHLPETDRTDLLQRFSTDHAAGVIIWRRRCCLRIWRCFPICASQSSCWTAASRAVPMTAS
jgi:LacI family transcriptional regulator